MQIKMTFPWSNALALSSTKKLLLNLYKEHEISPYQRILKTQMYFWGKNLENKLWITKPARLMNAHKKKSFLFEKLTRQSKQIPEHFVLCPMVFHPACTHA